MPNDPAPGGASRKLRLPDAALNTRAIPATRQPQRSWFRLHRHDRPALEFSIRPFHRYSHPDSPYAWLYLAASIHTCLWEVFGDDLFQDQHTIAASKWESRCITRITVPEIRVCAVSQVRTREALAVDTASLLATDLSVPQAWGLAIQRHPIGFQAIKFSSRFLNQSCLALFNRNQIQDRLRTQSLGPLTDLDAAADWLHDRQAALV